MEAEDTNKDNSKILSFELEGKKHRLRSVISEIDLIKNRAEHENVTAMDIVVDVDVILTKLGSDYTSSIDPADIKEIECLLKSISNETRQGCIDVVEEILSVLEPAFDALTVVEDSFRSVKDSVMDKTE